MFIERLVNQGNAPLVERMLAFTQKRHELIADAIANVSTPGYVRKDLDESGFQKLLLARVAERTRRGPGAVGFDDLKPGTRGVAEAIESGRGVLFHDRQPRSVEQLMSDLSSNALKHNMYVELLRNQYSSIQNALRERVG
jgi:flagellar basal-body rod protein FlgB